MQVSKAPLSSVAMRTFSNDKSKKLLVEDLFPKNSFSYQKEKPLLLTSICAALLRLMAQLSAQPWQGPDVLLYLVEKVAFSETARWSYLAWKGGEEEILGAHLAGSSGICQLKVFGQLQLQEAVAHKIIFLKVFSRTTGSSASRTRYHKYDPSRRRAVNFLPIFYSESATKSTYPVLAELNYVRTMTTA